MAQIRHPYNKHRRIIIRNAKLKKLASEVEGKTKDIFLDTHNAYFDEEKGCYVREYLPIEWKDRKRIASKAVRRADEVPVKGSGYKKLFTMPSFY